MRVQRAPRPAEQPVRPTGGLVFTPFFMPFSACVDLDLTRPTAALGWSRLVAEVAVALVAACHTEGLIDDETPLRIVRPDGHRLVGPQFDRAVHRSAYAVGTALASGRAGPSRPSPRALTFVDLGLSAVRAVGDWGVRGAGVATLGRVVATVVSRPLSDGSGPAVAHRQVAPFSLVVPDARSGSFGAVRAVAALADAVERMAG